MLILALTSALHACRQDHDVMRVQMVKGVSWDHFPDDARTRAVQANCLGCRSTLFAEVPVYEPARLEAGCVGLADDIARTRAAEGPRRPWHGA